MSVLKWRIVDPADPDIATNSYTWDWSPNTQTSPFGKKTISFLGTTAGDGQVMMWQGVTEPVQMTFGGSIPNLEQYEALRKWVYERSGRLFLYDHFGRRMTIILESFAPEPPQQHRGSRYWYHTYQISCWVLSITPPTVNNEGPI